MELVHFVQVCQQGVLDFNGGSSGGEEEWGSAVNLIVRSALFLELPP